MSEKQVNKRAALFPFSLQQYLSITNETNIIYNIYLYLSRCFLYEGACFAVPCPYSFIY